MRQHLLFFLPVLLTVSACSPAIAPRTGDTTPAGKFGWSVHGALWNFGWGRFERSPRDESVSTGGMDIYPEDRTFPWIMSAGLGMYDFGFSYGVTRWFELGASLGFQRMGGEARFAVLDEDNGDPVSLALGAGGYYTAIGHGPWGRAGLDVSIRLGQVAPLFNLYVSHGATYNSAYYDVPGNDDCPFEAPWQPCGELVGVFSYETRLSAALGVAFSVKKGDETPGVVTFGLVPHVVLHAYGQDRALGSRSDLRHDAGLHVVIGGQGPGW